MSQSGEWGYDMTLFVAIEQVGELYELSHVELLGALLHHGQVSEVVDVQAHALEAIPDGFASLTKGGFDHTAEESLVAIEFGHVVSLETDDAALDLGGRVEYVLVNGKEVLDVIVGLKKNTQDAVVAVARARGQALGHLALEHAYDHGYLILIVQNAEKNLAGYVVGEVANDGKGLARGKTEVLGLLLEEVAIDYGVDLVGVVGLEVLHALGVHLYELEVELGTLKEVLTQHTHAGANLHSVALVVQSVHNVHCNLLIDQKVLTQLFLGAYVVFRFHRYVCVAK